MPSSFIYNTLCLYKLITRSCISNPKNSSAGSSLIVRSAILLALYLMDSMNSTATFPASSILMNNVPCRQYQVYFKLESIRQLAYGQYGNDVQCFDCHYG